MSKGWAKGYPLHSGAVSSLNLLKGESLLLAQPIPSSLNRSPPSATPSSPLEPVSVGPVPNSGECESVLEGAYDVGIDDRRESGWLSVKPGESQGRFKEAMAEENGQEEGWEQRFKIVDNPTIRPAKTNQILAILVYYSLHCLRSPFGPS